jgi:heme-degrading monooxygenase HmoA|tara:strand:- start:1180 stop:1512 length:333 start_codon:yes stop_codon:yes gene_type:complete
MSIISITTKKVLPVYINRLINYQEALFNASATLPGLISTKTYNSVDTSLRTKHMSIISLTEWDSREAMDEWELSVVKLSIYNDYWRKHEFQLLSHNSILHRIKFSNIPLL